MEGLEITIRTIPRIYIQMIEADNALPTLPCRPEFLFIIDTSEPHLCLKRLLVLKYIVNQVIYMFTIQGIISLISTLFIINRVGNLLILGQDRVDMP